MDVLLYDDQIQHAHDITKLAGETFTALAETDPAMAALIESAHVYASIPFYEALGSSLVDFHPTLAGIAFDVAERISELLRANEVQLCLDV